MVYSTIDDFTKFLNNFKYFLRDFFGETQWNNLTINNHNEICYNNTSNLINSLLLCYEPKVKKLKEMTNSSNLELSKEFIKRIEDSFRYVNNKEQK